MDGVVNVNKPSGMTSHDVVMMARRMLKENRIGHTGTLDPLATGVLVLCIGKATRIAQYLEAGQKEYRAEMRLGITTDTLDADGRVLETRTYKAPDRAAILEVVHRFTGTIMQTPPAFSAVKIAGTPSHKLARQGRAVPNKPRPATIHSIDLTGFEDPFVRLRVRCAKGVYIRSLCADIGEALHAGAHLTSLQRTRSGRFSIDKAVTMEALAQMIDAGTIESAVTSIDEALADFPSVAVADTDAGRVLHGSRIFCSADAPGTCGRPGMVRVHDSLGRLLSLARHDGATIFPEVVFS